MSLATRCPACGTVFRVVQDQLRVSEGWVRCGRCSEVFNAVEHFVDAATASAPLPPQAPPAMASFRAAGPQAPAPGTDAWPGAWPDAGAGGLAGAGTPPGAAATATTPATPAAERPAGFPGSPAAGYPHAAHGTPERDLPAPAGAAGDGWAHDTAAADGPADAAAASRLVITDAEPPHPADGPGGVDALDIVADPRDRLPRPTDAALPRASLGAGAASDSSLAGIGPGIGPGTGPGDVAGSDAGLRAGGTRVGAGVTAAGSSGAVAAATVAALPTAAPPGKRGEAEVPARAGAAAAAEPLPSFLRRADSAARWRRPGVRAALALASVAAGAALLGQAAHTWRDELAARVPALAPALQAGCAALGCRIAAPLRIDALGVEGSALVRVARTQDYRLSVTLRNRADVPVAAPALDLTLTDAQGQTLLRRVLAAAELGAAAAAVPAGGEWVLQATVRADGPIVAGYTIELFYP